LGAQKGGSAGIVGVADPKNVNTQLAASPESVTEARRLANDMAAAWRFEGDDLVLVVSELVTNAIRHGRGPVEVDIHVDGSEVIVEVAEGSSSSPKIMDTTPDSVGGRGLPIVDALTRQWGVRSIPDGGKVVWARVPRR
jgi:anti-sigma regulatory factor (Ser/Thr protein kinase)